MKVSKSIALLFMFDRLRLKGELDPEEVKDEFNLLPKTVWRYVHDIREYYGLTNSPKKVVYSKKKKVYLLVNK